MYTIISEKGKYNYKRLLNSKREMCPYRVAEIGNNYDYGLNKMTVEYRLFERSLI